MAKPKRTSRLPGRDPTPIARRSRPREQRFPSTESDFLSLPLPSLPRVPRLSLLEDRRLFTPSPLGSPLPFRPALRSNFKPARLVVDTNVNRPGRSTWPAAFPSWKLAFQAPRGVMVCVRRHIRREVIHALGKAGIRGQKKPRRTAYSSVSCRR